MNNKLIGKVIFLVLCMLLGFLIAFQMKQNIQDYDLVTLKTIQQMRNEVNNAQKELSDLKALIEKRKGELKDFEYASSSEGDITEIVNKEVDEAKMIAGFKDVEGPGIIIKMEDNQDTQIVGPNINYDIIHDSDVLMIINDLKIAGAEAISITGQRVLSRSEIKCGGPIIKVNNQSIATPIIIKAIGDPKVLYAAINAPNTFGDQLRSVFKIVVETEVSDNILIPRYWGSPDFIYAKPVEEGE